MIPDVLPWRLSRGSVAHRLRAAYRQCGGGWYHFGTAATSDVSRTSTTADGVDDLDAHGRIYMSFRSAGGRKVASSNLAAPTKQAGIR
jgi:hypothetical protein